MCFFIFIEKSITVDDRNTRFEEAILKELEQTRLSQQPQNIKPDKIECFTKYVETCLREMNPDISKRVMKKILVLILEEDK